MLDTLNANNVQTWTHSRRHLLVVLSPLTTGLTPLFQQTTCDVNVQHRMTVNGYNKQADRFIDVTS